VTLAGYFLGTVPFVHQNLEKIILGILFVSLIPAMIAAWRGYRGHRRTPRAADEEPGSGHPTSPVRNESV
jgi:membrane-associated protein